MSSDQLLIDECAVVEGEDPELVDVRSEVLPLGCHLVHPSGQCQAASPGLAAEGHRAPQVLAAGPDDEVEGLGGQPLADRGSPRHLPGR